MRNREDDSPLVEDLEVLHQERRGGTYHRIVDSPPVIENNTLYIEEEDSHKRKIQSIGGRTVKITSEKLNLYRRKSDEQFTLYHVYIKHENQ